MAVQARDSVSETVRLRRWTSCGGCGAKWPASSLRALLDARPTVLEPEGLLVGLGPFDDAAVFDLGSGMSLVSTTDFFPPLVDAPSDFGAVAAANACSDVFAMGARVLMALNVAAFPEELPPEVVAEVFDAASAVVRDAGGVVAGGHTIRNPEPVFGLAVQGLVETGAHFTKGGVRPGDVLVLSKPLGTGLVLAQDDEDAVAVATSGMRTLNRAASEALVERRSLVHAVTDVSGFGLLGHAMEMGDRSEATLEFDAGALPAYRGALDAAAAGVRTGGDVRNREYTGDRVDVTAGETEAALAFDPQTSGGLLAAVDASVVDELREFGFVPVGAAGSPSAVAVRLS
jgi:selenide,water dikinase